MKLDVDIINTKSPYKVYLVPNTHFVSFLTYYGVQYAVGFEKDNTSLCNRSLPV